MLHETKHDDHPGITKFFHEVHDLFLKVPHAAYPLLTPLTPPLHIPSSYSPSYPLLIFPFISPPHIPLSYPALISPTHIHPWALITPGTPVCPSRVSLLRYCYAALHVSDLQFFSLFVHSSFLHLCIFVSSPSVYLCFFSICVSVPSPSVYLAMSNAPVGSQLS